jgi:hypothetical protein
MNQTELSKKSQKGTFKFGKGLKGLCVMWGLTTALGSFSALAVLTKGEFQEKISSILKDPAQTFGREMLLHFETMHGEDMRKHHGDSEIEFSATEKAIEDLKAGEDSATEKAIADLKPGENSDELKRLENRLLWLKLFLDFPHDLITMVEEIYQKGPEEVGFDLSTPEGCEGSQEAMRAYMIRGSDHLKRTKGASGITNVRVKTPLQPICHFRWDGESVTNTFSELVKLKQGLTLTYEHFPAGKKECKEVEVHAATASFPECFFVGVFAGADELPEDFSSQVMDPFFAEVMAPVGREIISKRSALQWFGIYVKRALKKSGLV